MVRRLQPAAALALVLVSLGCSASPPSGSAPPGSNGDPPGQGIAPAAPSPAPSEAALRALSAELALRDGCADTCCLGAIPPWLTGRGAYGSEAVPVDALRGLVDATADARVRALAIRWLAQAEDMADLPRLARFVDAALPIGRLPSVMISQAVLPCYPVRWEPRTLGLVSLEALADMTAQPFDSAAAFHAWRRQNPDPLRSFSYWERALGRQRPPPPRLLETLRRTDAELYAKVLLSDFGSLGYGVADAEITRAAREGLGPDRLLRVVLGDEVWPEIGGTPHRRSGVLAAVLQRADAIFAPAHGAALLALWEQGGLRDLPHARAWLAVAAGRFHPATRCGILTAQLDEGEHGQDLLLEELARHCAAKKQPVLAAWFYGAKAQRDARHDRAVAILKGLGASGAAARPSLRALVRVDQPIAEDEEATEALVNAVRAAGYPDAFPQEQHIRARAGKNMYQGPDGERAWEAAKRAAAAARRDCVRRAVAWLSSR